MTDPPRAPSFPGGCTGRSRARALTNNRSTGSRLRYTGGQTLFGAYPAPAAPTDAAPVSVQFTDDPQATLTWPGGTYYINGDLKFVARRTLPGRMCCSTPSRTIRSMSIHGHADYTSADDLTKCTGDFDMDDPSPAGASSSGFVNHGGSFEGDLQITDRVAAFTATGKTMDGQVTTRDVLKAVGLNLHMQGSVVGDFLTASTPSRFRSATRAGLRRIRSRPLDHRLGTGRGAA